MRRRKNSMPEQDVFSCYSIRNKDRTCNTCVIFILKLLKASANCRIRCMQNRTSTGKFTVSDCFHLMVTDKYRHFNVCHLPNYKFCLLKINVCCTVKKSFRDLIQSFQLLEMQICQWISSLQTEKSFQFP